MKKFFSGFLIGALIFSAIGVFAATYVANPVSFKVLVNGEEFVSEPPALVVEGRTYLPLRAMGDALGVPVEWNEELRQAEVGDRKHYKPTEPQKTENSKADVPSKYKTYEGTTIIDFGEFVGSKSIEEKTSGDGTKSYVYDLETIDMKLVEDFVKEIKNTGYTFKEAEKTALGTTSWVINYDNLDMNPFVFSLEQDVAKDYSHIIISYKLK